MKSIHFLYRIPAVQPSPQPSATLAPTTCSTTCISRSRTTAAAMRTGPPASGTTGDASSLLRFVADPNGKAGKWYGNWMRQKYLVTVHIKAFSNEKKGPRKFAIIGASVAYASLSLEQTPRALSWKRDALRGASSSRRKAMPMTSPVH